MGVSSCVCVSKIPDPLKSVTHEYTPNVEHTGDINCMSVVMIGDVTGTCGLVNIRQLMYH